MKTTKKAKAKNKKVTAKKEVTTNKTELRKLQSERDVALKAIAAYNAYRQRYNQEHPDDKVSVRTTLIKEIITLHKKGKSNKQIVEAGYNKNTVNKFIGQYKKGMKQEKTVVRQYLSKKRGEEEEDEGGEE